MMMMEKRAVSTTKVLASSTKTTSESHHQGIATLLVMCAVLAIIVMFCCFSAAGIRGLCKKYIFRCRCCRQRQRDVDDNVPTVILLPYGRMLVVDSAVFDQLQADRSGIDLLRLSAHLIDRHRQVVLDLPPSYSEVMLARKDQK